MNFDGTNQHQVFSDGNFQDWTPSFAPDGSHLIFTRCNRLGLQNHQLCHLSRESRWKRP